MITLTSKEELRENMFLANERQKNLLKKRDSLLESENVKNQEDALKITHEIAKIQDFIKFAENTLKMLD